MFKKPSAWVDSTIKNNVIIKNNLCELDFGIHSVFNQITTYSTYVQQKNIYIYIVHAGLQITEPSVKHGRSLTQTLYRYFPVCSSTSQQLEGTSWQRDAVLRPGKLCQRCAYVKKKVHSRLPKEKEGYFSCLLYK